MSPWSSLSGDTNTMSYPARGLMGTTSAISCTVRAGDFIARGLSMVRPSISAEPSGVGTTSISSLQTLQRCRCVSLHLI